MNKTTRLALAAIAGFGLCAQGKTVTQDLWDIDFDNVTLPEAGVLKLSDMTVSEQAAFTNGGWTVAGTDDSVVTNGPISVYEDGSFVTDDTQYIELDTQGESLTWTPSLTSTGTVSVIDADIRFVPADDPPEGFDPDDKAQTALYLHTNYDPQEQDVVTGYQLFAWVTDMEPETPTNYWQAVGGVLPTTFVDDFHHVQVLIDYSGTTAKVHVKLDGTELADPDSATTTLWDTANVSSTTNCITAVTFKGTGAVDNFVGTGRTISWDSFDFTAQVFVDGELQAAGIEGNTTRTETAMAGDDDDDTLDVTFAAFMFDDYDDDVGEATYALSKIAIVDLEDESETVYDYSSYYDATKFTMNAASIPAGYPAVFKHLDDDPAADLTGAFSITPLTYGGTSNAVIAKLYFKTLGAYDATVDTVIAGRTEHDTSLVKPSDAGTTLTWDYPAEQTENGSNFVLRTVQVLNDATLTQTTNALGNFTVSYEVLTGGLGADKTFAVGTYVYTEGHYDGDALEWVYDSSTGTYTLQRKTFTVTFTWEDGSSSSTNTYDYGDALVVPAISPTYEKDGATYTFTGWLPATNHIVTAAVDYVAQYEQTTAPAATVLVITDNGDGTATTNTVGTYGSLADAVDAAPAGATVVLLDDVALTATQVIDKDLTIDLNGNDIAATDCRAIWVKQGTVVLTGEGTVSANGNGLAESSSVIRVGDSAVNANTAALTIGEDVTVSTAKSYAVTVFGKNAGNIGLDVYGTVASTATGEADAAISGNGNAGLSPVAITIHDGATVTAVNQAGIYMPGAGTLTIEGGTITAPTAVYAKAGTVNVSGGTLTGTGAETAYQYYGNGPKATGDAIVLDNCGYPNGATFDANITGGTFISQNAKTVGSYAYGTDATTGEARTAVEDIIPATITVEGVEVPNPARFSDAEADGVPEGYRLVEDPDHPGLFMVAPIVMHLAEDSITLRYNSVTNVTVVDYPEGATFGWTISTNGVVFKPTAGPVKINSGKTTASVKVYSETAAFQTATATVAVTNNGVQIGTLAATIVFEDVAAIVDGVSYTKAQFDQAIADAISSGKVLEHYLGVSTSISKGQTLRTLKLAGRNGTASVKAAASTSPVEAWTIAKATDSETGVITWTVNVTESDPNVRFVSADGVTTNYFAETFSINQSGTYTLLKDTTRSSTLSITSSIDATLDLNGHVLTSTSTSKTGAAINMGAVSGTRSLRIKDSVGGGRIVANNITGGYVVYGRGNSALVVESGEIATSGTNSGAIFLSGTAATASITGGTFNAGILNMDDSARGTITVTGGSFYGFDPQNNTSEGAGTDFVAAGYASVADTPSAGWYTVVPAFTVTWKNGETVLETDLRVPTNSVPSYNGETPVCSTDSEAEFLGWKVNGTGEVVDLSAFRVATNTVFVAAFDNQEEEHEGAKSEEGFIILVPADPANEDHEQLAFTTFDPAAGTATISACMLNPNNAETVTLRLRYRTSLTGTDLYVNATISNIDTEHGTADVTWVQPNVDTFFVMGFDNQTGVED